MILQLCQCRTVPQPEYQPDVIYGPCTATTGATFAPGHDARLKGLLTRLHRAGQTYRFIEGGMLTEADPLEYSDRFNWRRLILGSTKPKARTKPKQNRVAIPRKVPRETLSPVPIRGTVKIGRRRFPCEVDLETSDEFALSVIYTDPKTGAQIRNDEVMHNDFTATN